VPASGQDPDHASATPPLVLTETLLTCPPEACAAPGGEGASGSAEAATVRIPMDRGGDVGRNTAAGSQRAVDVGGGRQRRSTTSPAEYLT
jgi:hypothetical protein